MPLHIYGHKAWFIKLANQSLISGAPGEQFNWIIWFLNKHLQLDDKIMNTNYEEYLLKQVRESLFFFPRAGISRFIFSLFSSELHLEATHNKGDETLIPSYLKVTDQVQGMISPPPQINMIAIVAGRQLGVMVNDYGHYFIPTCHTPARSLPLALTHSYAHYLQ